MIEVWSPLRERGEDNFSVSTHGRVFNMLTEEMLEPFFLQFDVYLKVSLNNGFYNVHELVADAHICCLDCDIWEVFHIDGDQTNNNVWNLDMRQDQDELDYWRNNCE